MADAVVWLVTYLDRADVAIERGENAGKTMAYTQVVTKRQVLGMWEAATGANLKLPLDEVLDENSTGVAVLVQQERAGLPGPDHRRRRFRAIRKLPKENPVLGGKDGTK